MYIKIYVKKIIKNFTEHLTFTQSIKIVVQMLLIKYLVIVLTNRITLEENSSHQLFR